MRKIDLIVIHCSATRENTDYSPEQLESDHKARGFLRAGYNFYIRKSGEVVNLRPLEQIPAHARGHNKHSIGICYEGGLDITGQSRDTRTQAQKDLVVTFDPASLNLLSRLMGSVGTRDLSEDLNGDGTISPMNGSNNAPHSTQSPNTKNSCMSYEKK